jgi:DNA-binding CsgD family transcriptional regulator
MAKLRPMRASWSELNRLSAALADLYAPGGLEDYPARVLAAMQQLLPADIHAYHEFAPGHFRAVDTPDVLTESLVEAFVAHIDEHPSIQFIQQTGCHEPLMFSDFVSLRDFRQTGLYWEFFRKVDVDRQVAGIVNAGDMDIGYAFNRRRTSYSEEDRLLLQLLADHFPKARRNAQLWSPRQGGTNNQSGPPVLGVNAQGRIRIGTAAAARLLHAYFPDTPADRLAEPLIRWMETQRAQFRVKDKIPKAPGPFCVTAKRGRLTIRYSPPDFSNLEYLLLEETLVPAPVALSPLGLTQRETEVLHWLSEGKRNAEIAVILGTTTRTVGKHLEHIFAKLGVETRAAAAAIARDCRHGDR